MTLYRTYRPQTFADVIGQDHIVTTLERALAKDRVSHAYLFSGTRGTGKTSVARILARALLLQDLSSEHTTVLLQALSSDSLPDLIEIDAASNRGIDDVRELIESVQFAPTFSKRKVYIIDEVHMMTKDAFNALLKTLEEPPSYAYFILATTEREKVPDTIQSRCQRFVFKTVSDDAILSRLQYIADQEHIIADREALRLLAHHARGSFRDGISLLDQFQSLDSITVSDIQDRLGLSVKTIAEEMLVALESLSDTEVHRLITLAQEMGITADMLLSSILELLREELHRQMQASSVQSTLLRSIDQYLDGLPSVRSSQLPYLTLESVLLHSYHSLAESPSNLSHQDVAMSQTVRSIVHPTVVYSVPNTVPHTVVDTTSHTVQSSPDVRPSIIEAPVFSKEELTKHWRAIVDHCSIPSLKMSIKLATIHDVHGTTVTLLFPSDFNRQKVEEPKSLHALEEQLMSVFHAPIRVVCKTDRDIAVSNESKRADMVDAAKEVFGIS